MDNKPESANSAEGDRLLTAVEAAKELGVSRAKLYTDYINTQMLVPAGASVLKQPKRRFSRADVERLREEEVARRRAEREKDAKRKG